MAAQAPSCKSAAEETIMSKARHEETVVPAEKGGTHGRGKGAGGQISRFQKLQSLEVINQTSTPTLLNPDFDRWVEIRQTFWPISSQIFKLTTQNYPSAKSRLTSDVRILMSIRSFETSGALTHKRPNLPAFQKKAGFTSKWPDGRLSGRVAGWTSHRPKFRPTGRLCVRLHTVSIDLLTGTL
jgi:hypothetical protein